MSLHFAIACVFCFCHFGDAVTLAPGTEPLSSAPAPLAVPVPVNATASFLNAIIVRKGAIEELFGSAGGVVNAQLAANGSQIIGSNKETKTEDGTCAQCSKAEFEHWLQKKAANREEERRMRIEIIKALILNRLGLVEAPNSTLFDDEGVIGDVMDYDGYFDDVDTWDTPRHVKQGLGTEHDFQADSPYQHGHHQEDKDDTLNAIKRIIIYGKPVQPCQSNVPAACFIFPLSPTIVNLDIDTIASAHLKLHVKVPYNGDVSDDGTHNYLKMKRHIVAMYHYNSSHTNSSKPTARFVDAREVSSNKQPIAFDVTHTLAVRMRHALRKRTNHIFHGTSSSHDRDAMALQFQCKTCADGQAFDVTAKGRHAPYVVIKVGKPRRRQRRHVIECQPLSTICCRDTLYIDFAAIGWNHWILQPSGYYANFCRGECQGLMLPSTRHQSVVSHYDVIEPIPKYRSCCAATRYSPLSLLYFDESDGTIKERRLDNLQVESCACTT